MTDHAQSPNVVSLAYVLGSMACNLTLLLWGVFALLKPGGPRGEELAVIYWWVVPLIMLPPAQVAIKSWLNCWQLTPARLVLYNAPFALAVVLWAWVASLPT